MKKYISFWSIFRKEFFPTHEEQLEKLIQEKERLEKLIVEGTQKK